MGQTEAGLVFPERFVHCQPMRQRRNFPILTVIVLVAVRFANPQIRFGPMAFIAAPWWMCNTTGPSACVVIYVFSVDVPSLLCQSSSCPVCFSVFPGDQVVFGLALHLQAHVSDVPHGKRNESGSRSGSVETVMRHSKMDMTLYHCHTHRAAKRAEREKVLQHLVPEEMRVQMRKPQTIQ